MTYLRLKRGEEEWILGKDRFKWVAPGRCAGACVPAFTCVFALLSLTALFYVSRSSIPLLR